MKALSAVLLALCLTSLAFAQNRPFLSKAEVEALASGKVWSFPIQTGIWVGETMQWTLEAGGYLRAVAIAHPYAPDKGTWLVNEKAQLCVKFVGSFTDRCVAVLKDDGKLTMVDSNNMDGVFADLSVR